MTTIYVPARGQRICMPHGQPDWPEDGRPVNEASAYETRMVRDGDLVPAPETKTSKKKEAQ